MQGAASAALAIGVSVFSTGAQALNDCTPGSGSATPGTTVTCTGNVANQDGANADYGTGSQTGITINVGDNALFSGGAQRAIWVGDAVINTGVGAWVDGSSDGIVAATGSLAINNRGTITTNTAAGDTAIRAATGITLTNQATGSIFGRLWGVVSAGGITADNAGFINGGTGAALRAQSDVTLTNRAGATIIGLANGVVSTAGAITIDNTGLISSPPS